MLFLAEILLMLLPIFAVNVIEMLGFKSKDARSVETCNTWSAHMQSSDRASIYD